MKISDAIRQRRSVRRFTDRAVSRADIETLLDAAVLAPNHRLTQPWHFFVLGPEARTAYGLALGDRKARKIADPDAARAMRDAVAREYRALPAMIAVAVATTADPEAGEEDYAATMMGVANLGLVALEHGLGTQIRTGAILNDPAARLAMGVADGLRVVAVINVGEPADHPPARPRTPAAERTTWTA